MTAAAHPRPDLPAIDTANAPRPRGHYSQARIAGDLIFTAGSFRSTRRPVRWSARATSRNRPAKSSARSLQSRPAGRPQARPWCELAKTDKEYDLGAQTGDLLCLDCGETWWSRSPVPRPQAQRLTGGRRRPGYDHRREHPCLWRKAHPPPGAAPPRPTRPTPSRPAEAEQSHSRSTQMRL
jgi:hypothetical protein